MDQTLANNSYVDPSVVGRTNLLPGCIGHGDSVECHTDLTTIVVVLIVFLVETGISLTELDCHTHKVLAFLNLVTLRELIYVKMPMLLQLVSITVIFLLLLSMITLQREADQSMWDSMPMMEVYTNYNI